LAKNTPIFAIYKYQFEYKKQKIIQFENLFEGKKEEKLNLYLTLHQVLQILKYITQVFRKLINHTQDSHPGKVCDSLVQLMNLPSL
jgi:hypothetical protein